MSSGERSSTWFEVAAGPTAEQDAEDLALVLREARETRGCRWPTRPAAPAGVTAAEVLGSEAGRVVPARAPFASYMRALGFVA